MKINVGVIFGGRSTEHEVSVISAMQCIHAIDKRKYDVTPIYIAKDGSWYTGNQLSTIENYKDIDQLLSNSKKILLSPNANEHKLFNYFAGFFTRHALGKIDVAFPVIHGTHVEDGILQGFLELMNIPYVGPNVLSSALGMDKVLQKIVFREHGIPVLDCIPFYSSEWIKNSEKIITDLENQIGYPMIIKPVNLGSSVGVGRAKNREELIDAVDLAKSFSHQVLAEKMITNLKEINCSVLGDRDHIEVSVCEEPISSIDVLTFQDKYESSQKTKGMSGAKRKLPAEIPEETAHEIQQMAKKAFLALDGAGVSRIDFLIDQDTNKIYLNEPNTIPGSLAFYLWEASGKTFTDLTTQLIELALKRSREKNQLIFTYETNILKDFQGGIKGSVKGGVKSRMPKV
jgi:D-alanine-D-alanine ligase